MRRCGLTLLLWLAAITTSHAADTVEQEIDHLLNAVVSSDCIFIRNGKEYGGEEAKNHLNLKRRRGKRYFSSAEEFVERLASSSSWSGNAYYIRCGDAERQLAREWFTAVLQKYRSSH